MIGTLLRHTVYRIRTGDELLRHELRYLFRQARATLYLQVHLLTEARVRPPTRDKKLHVECNYPDPPDHTVIACHCGKEWS